MLALDYYTITTTESPAIATLAWWLRARALETGKPVFASLMCPSLAGGHYASDLIIPSFSFIICEIEAILVFISCI